MKENKKIVKPDGQIPTQPKGEYFLIDNPDLAHLNQRVEIHGDSIIVIDNLPCATIK